MEYLLNFSKKVLLPISLILFSISSFSQCSDCNNSIVIPNIPFTDINTTCGKCDNFSQVNGCSWIYDSYLNGDDVVYTYTPSTNEVIDFVISNNDNYTGIFIMDGCPTASGTNCIKSFASISGNITLGGIVLNEGVTYYIIISSDAPPQCVNYTLNIFPNIPSSSCNPNIIGNTCATATSICNTNGYCGTTGSNTIDTWPELTSAFASCTNYAIIHNNSFLEFVADSSVAVFNILIDNCIGGDQLQVMVFDNVCSGSVTPYSCYGEINASSETQTFFASGLTPGNTYKIMIDGEGGATCDYNIKAISGVAVSSAANTISNITICEGNDTTLTASGNAPFLWSPGGETTPSITVSPLLNTIYTAISTGTCGNVNDTFNLTTLPLPNAGTDNSITLCHNNSSINLFDSLGGNPDAGGTWFPIPISGSGIFDPAIDPSGTYSYIIDNSVCPPATSTITVVVNPAPNAGTDNSITLCHSDAPINLFDSLNGSPDTGGTWLPAPISGSGIFDPAIDPSGTYSYIIDNSICPPVTSTITVMVNSLPNTGADNSITLCPNDAPINLFNSLNGSPDTGGTWLPAPISGSGIFNPAIDPSGSYNYTIDNSICPAITSTITVVVNSLPNAGTDSSITLCNDDSPINLLDFLGGNTDTSGVWIPSPISGSGIFNPVIDTSGVYTYTLSGTSSCIGTANLSIIINPLPIANFTTSSESENSISFTNLSTGAINYEWTIDDFLVLNDVHPYYIPTKPGEFDVQLIAFSAEGCSDTIQNKVKVNEEPLIYIPNAFSPNDDGINDIFKVSGLKPENFNLFIFNRWGELIFQSNDFNKGWNGKYKGVLPEQTETYIWKIQYTTHSNVINQMHGTVTLLK